MNSIRFIFCTLLALFALNNIHAQEADTLHTSDSIIVTEESKIVMEVVEEEAAATTQEAKPASTNPEETKVEAKRERKLKIHKEYFTPDPKRATWYAIVCPGLGQIYNRSYWKLPILYGGMLACTYLITWNGRMYNDYRNAYHDIIDDDPRTNSYMTLFPSYDGSQSWMTSTLKSKTNSYRRTRDMSVFAMVLLYMVSAVDAFVDAHLYDFTVSDDLSLRIEPVINNFGSGEIFKSRSFGMQCSIRF